MEEYWVQIFNRRQVERFNKQVLLSALLDANFESLCFEYGLDHSEIGLVVSQLALLSAPGTNSPLLQLKYQAEPGLPLTVYRWAADSKPGEIWLSRARNWEGHSGVKDRLRETREIFAISLRPQQLADFGLLLAYEVSRWVGSEGDGLVFGLDGVWYRLNRHQAFMPIKASARN